MHGGALLVHLRQRGGGAARSAWAAPPAAMGRPTNQPFATSQLLQPPWANLPTLSTRPSHRPTHHLDSSPTGRTVMQHPPTGQNSAPPAPTWRSNSSSWPSCTRYSTRSAGHSRMPSWRSASSSASSLAPGLQERRSESCSLQADAQVSPSGASPLAPEAGSIRSCAAAGQPDSTSWPALTAV